MESSAEIIGAQLGTLPGEFWMTAVALFVFGIFYEWLIRYLHRYGLNDGYTWLEVVVGVLITVIAAGAVVGWGNVILLIILFACSGLPMAAGDIYRHVRSRRAEAEEQDDYPAA